MRLGFGVGTARGGRPAGGKPRIELLALSLTATAVSEAVGVGTVVGTFSGFAEGSTLSLVADGGGKFALSGTSLVVAAALDYETTISHTVTVREANPRASNSPRETTFTITVTDVDDTAPVISTAATANVAENSPLSIALAANESVTWAISGGADAALFEISGTTLRWAANTTRDFEAPADADANNVYVVTVRATDTAGNATTKTISVTVTDVDDTAPVITTAATANVAENAPLSIALSANEPVTWAISGGADAALFEISGTTLRWKGNLTRDFEAPADADANNVYVVTVRATDAGGNATTKTISVTVTDVDDWTPAALGGKLIMWWDAEDASSVTQAGSAVSAWADKVSGHSLVQATSAFRPVLVSEGINGRPAVVFDGTDDGLSGAGVPPRTPTGMSRENWILALASGTPVNETGLFRQGTSTAVRAAIARASTDAYKGRVGNGSTEITVTAAPLLARPSVIRHRVTADGQLLQNTGVPDVSNAFTPNIDNSSVSVGAMNSAGSQPFMGAINTVIQTELLDETEAALLRAYLKARGNIA